MKKIKSIILILALFVGIQCLTVKKARAIDCSVKYNSGFFTQTEVRIALSDITNLLFQATIAFLGKDTNRISERCHLEIGVAIFPDTLSVQIKFGEKIYVGGSHKIALVGLREAVIRAFYQEELFRRRICRLFGPTYKLNCVAFEKK